MIFLVSLIPATILAVFGYLVFYASTRTEGGLKRFGQFLGAWTFFLAGATVLGGLLGSIIGIQNPMGNMRQHMERMEQIEQGQLDALRGLQRN